MTKTKLAATLESVASFIPKPQRSADIEARITERAAKIPRDKAEAEELAAKIPEATYAAANNVPGADTLRDELRGKVTYLRESVHELESLQDVDRRLLEDARAREKAAADAGKWRAIEADLALGKAAAEDIESALANLGDGLRRLLESTNRIRAHGFPSWTYDLSAVEYRLKNVWGETIAPNAGWVRSKPVTSTVAQQHGEIMRRRPKQ